MEPLFRNIDVKTDSKYREICRNAFLAYHIVYLLFFCLGMAYNIYWLWYDYSINPLMLGYVIITVVAYITRPYSYAKKRYKSYNALYHQPETDEVLFYDEFFIDKDVYSKSETKISYESVTSVKISKSYYIFSVKDTTAKFTIGKDIESLADRTDFTEFINSKLVNSKRKIK